MITLTGKQSEYKIENSNEHLKITGSVVIAEDNHIVTLNGSFNTLEDLYIGTFNYSETNNGKCTKNIGDIDIDNINNADELLRSTINELKAMIDEL